MSHHRDRIEAYFASCGEGTAEEIAAHFTPDAVIYDTNIKPMVGASVIGASWVKVRDRWGGARWIVDTCVIEWSMTGTDPGSGGPFVFRGSEHYRMVDGRIAEIRQYWTFDPDRLDTGLLGWDYTG
jgi:ketosteroid isomerase-like protein